MKKKIGFSILAVFLLAVACIVYVVRVPDLTIYFDSGKGNAFTMQTKTGVIKKIKLPGYDKVSFVTPFDGGYYCRAEKDGEDYFLLVQDGRVMGELPEPQHGGLYSVDMYAADDGLYIIYLDDGKAFFADFANEQITELPLSPSQHPNDLLAHGDTVLLERDDPENGMCIYRYKNKTLTELAQGYMRVFLSETQFLYQTKDYAWMLYDLTTGTSQPATQKVNFDLCTSMMGWQGAPAAANGWLAVWRAGIPAHEATALVSGVTVTNVNTGESYWLPTLLGRHTGNLQAVSNA